MKTLLTTLALFSILAQVSVAKADIVFENQNGVQSEYTVRLTFTVSGDDEVGFDLMHSNDFVRHLGKKNEYTEKEVLAASNTQAKWNHENPREVGSNELAEVAMTSKKVLWGTTMKIQTEDELSAVNALETILNTIR
jgi:hypothetical protein